MNTKPKTPRGRPRIYKGGQLVRVTITLRQSTLDSLTTLASIRAQRSGVTPSISLAADMVLTAGLSKINEIRKGMHNEQ